MDVTCLDICIIYFIPVTVPIPYIKIAELDNRFINNKYICTIYTHLNTCLMSITRFALRDKVIFDY